MSTGKTKATANGSHTAPKVVALPHTAVIERLLGSNSFADAMWRCIDSDPLTAVHIANEHGLILYANDQAARAFLGKGVKGRDAMGLFWHELFPAELVRERINVLRAVQHDGEPRYVRSIYFGLQLISRYDAVGPVPGVADGGQVFLSVTRHEPRALEVDGIPGVKVITPTTNHLGRLAVLTPREIELMALIAEGLSISEIAEHLGKSEHTVNEQRRSVGKKLGVSGRVQLAEIAREAGLKRGDILSSIEHLAKPKSKAAGPDDALFDPRVQGLACPGFVRGLWRALNDDPFTGLQIATPESRLVHINQQAVDMFVPELRSPANLIGKTYLDVAPRDLAEDRIRIMASVAQLRRARTQRSIYQGYQIVTRIEYAGKVPGVGDGQPLVMLAARRTPAEALERIPARARKLLVRPRVQRLGPLAQLSPREREVLALIGEGLSNRQIAFRLHRTEDTVEDHRRAIGRKLHIDDRVKLAEVARQAGLALEDADTPSADITLMDN